MLGRWIRFHRPFREGSAAHGHGGVCESGQLKMVTPEPTEIFHEKTGIYPTSRSFCLRRCMHMGSWLAIWLSCTQWLTKLPRVRPLLKVPSKFEIREKRL